MQVHFIAIGGSAMHNLAIALSRKGFEVSGSDDEIFEPSRTRLQKQGILPVQLGWDATRTASEIEHATQELARRLPATTSQDKS